MYSQWKRELGWNKSTTLLAQLNILSLATFHTNFVQAWLQWPQSSRNDCLSIVERSSSSDNTVSMGDSDRAARLLCLCSIFSFLHQAYQSSLPKVLTLKQPVWCERSIKLTTPWIVVHDGMSKSQNQTGRVEMYSGIHHKVCTSAILRSAFHDTLHMTDILFVALSGTQRVSCTFIQIMIGKKSKSDKTDAQI